jgi:hypothetical protein
MDWSSARNPGRYYRNYKVIVFQMGFHGWKVDETRRSDDFRN